MRHTLAVALNSAALICTFALSASAGVVQPAPVPEPATVALIGIGIGAVLGIRYYRSRPK